MLDEYNSVIAPFLMRVFLGILFFFQGYDKVFRVGVRGVAEAFQSPMQQHSVGRPILLAGAWLTSYIELVGGVLLILGLFTYAALYALGLDLLVATIGLSIMQPVWDLQHVFRRFILLVLLLLIPEHWDTLSLDYLLR